MYRLAFPTETTHHSAFNLLLGLAAAFATVDAMKVDMSMDMDKDRELGGDLLAALLNANPELLATALTGANTNLLANALLQSGLSGNSQGTLT